MAKGIFEDITQFEQKLSLPEGFYDKLLEEDDWSFVVKLSALFEAACAHILTKRLDAPELEGAFAELDHANPRYGKVVLLTKLGSINEEQSKFLSELAKLRNRLVHNISNVGFSFKSHISQFDSNQRKSFVTIFGHGINDPFPFEGKKVSRHHFVLSSPRFAIWVTAAEVLGCLHLEIEVTEHRKQLMALAEYAKLVSARPE